MTKLEKSLIATLAAGFSMTAVAAGPMSGIGGGVQADQSPTPIAGPVEVTIDATATGGFGDGNSGFTPMVKAITVTRPGTIIISYVSGTWCGASSDACSGPNGIPGPSGGQGYDGLLQAVGVYGTISNYMAIVGAFVPAVVQKLPGFQPTDATKLTSGVGIMPDKLFFVGANNFLTVSTPGTLYLGVNDTNAGDNTGSMIVKVSEY